MRSWGWGPLGFGVLMDRGRETQVTGRPPACRHELDHHRGLRLPGALILPLIPARGLDPGLPTSASNCARACLVCGLPSHQPEW